MTAAILSLGSNLGERIAHLQAAVDSLAAAPAIDVAAVSAVYETDPVGGPDQDDYLNAVVLVSTTLAPEQLLDVAQDVEQSRGRVRQVRWGARTLDVDLVDVDGIRLRTPRLELPHPRAAQRAFVLVPWLDVDGGAVLAGTPVRRLLAALDSSGVRRRDDLSLVVAA